MMVFRAAALALVLTAVVGCQQEEKLVRYKPFFSGLENVETQTPQVAEQPPMAIEDGGELTEESLVIENPDGTRRLIIKSGGQLMAHIQRTLEAGEVDLFVEQVLSKLTRAEYHQRGLDPKEAFRTLKAGERDIRLLFSRMPMGEHSPHVRMEPLGRNAFRVRLTGLPATTVGRYKGFDMVLEDGNWRLRWFN